MSIAAVLQNEQPYHVENTDVFTGLSLLPDRCVHCLVSSPPYLGLRDYGIPPRHWSDGLICCYGLEPDVASYVRHTVELFEEFRRVLRDDGVIWWNIGDSYFTGAGSCNNPGGGDSSMGKELKASGNIPTGPVGANRMMTEAAAGFRTGNKMLIPHRVAIALADAGWIIRQDNVWAKKSPMPESISGWRWSRCRVKVAGGDCKRYGSSTGSGYEPKETRMAKWSPCPGCPRCIPNGGYVLRKGSHRTTGAHEYIFQIVKSGEYFCDGDAAAEIGAGHPSGNKTKRWGQNHTSERANGTGSVERQSSIPWEGSEMRNPRSVWHLSSESYKGAHFACVDSETEALTAEGWKTYDKLRVGELSAQYDLESQRLSWGPIEAVATYSVADQEMIVGKSRDYDFWLTPNHRCVIQRRHKKGGKKPAEIVLAENLKSQHYFPTAAEWDHSGAGPGVHWASLCGWHIAEGHEKKSGLGVEIYQSKSANPEFCEVIEAVLNACGAEYERADYRRKYRGSDRIQSAFHVHGFAAAKLRSLCPGKGLPPSVLLWSDEECRALLAALYMGDGHSRPDGRVSFIQKRADISDMAQALAIRCGYSATLSPRAGGVNTLFLTKHNLRSMRGTNGKGKPLDRKPYTGIVWCPKLPLGTWVARRNGRVFITGNTFPSELARRCIVASCSPGGCCPQCGNQYAPRVSKERIPTRPALNPKVWRADEYDEVSQRSELSPNRDPMRHIAVSRVEGYFPTCTCKAGPSVPPIVLEPFTGSGTTIQVARHMGFRAIGFEVNPKYIELAKERIEKVPRCAMPKKKAAKKVVKAMRQQLDFLEEFCET